MKKILLAPVTSDSVQSLLTLCKYPFLRRVDRCRHFCFLTIHSLFDLEQFFIHSLIPVKLLFLRYQFFFFPTIFQIQKTLPGWTYCLYDFGFYLTALKFHMPISSPGHCSEHQNLFSQASQTYIQSWSKPLPPVDHWKNHYSPCHPSQKPGSHPRLPLFALPTSLPIIHYLSQGIASPSKSKSPPMP